MVRKCTLTFSCLKSQPIWLSGPGCSSVGGGAFTELGPFYPRGDGRGLRLNKKSWNRGRSLGCRYISIPFFFSKEWKVQVLTFSLLLCCFFLPFWFRSVQSSVRGVTGWSWMVLFEHFIGLQHWRRADWSVALTVFGSQRAMLGSHCSSI